MSSDNSAICDEEDHLFYQEIVEENKTLFQCSICFRLLSRKQRIQSHLQLVHGKGPFKRKYKLYAVDRSIPIPRTTHYNRKRLKASCSIERLESGSSDNNLYSSTAFGSEVCFGLRSSQATASATCDPTCISTDNLEELQPINDQFCSKNDSTDSVKQLDPLCEQSNPSEDDVDDDYRDYSEETESGTSTSEPESDTDSEVQYCSSDEEERSDNDQDNIDIRLCSHHEKACMAVLAYVSRHCITNEAAKDLIDLVKVTCPDSATFKSLNYSQVQEVCGKCEMHVYDICEKCHRLFPLDDENCYHCSTTGCAGLRYRGGVPQQGKKAHKNSFVTVNIHNQLKDLLQRDGSCGLNVHNTGAHLTDYVEGWGPLWAWSTFGFEDMNGTIMDLTHGTGNVCRQLIWMLHAQRRLRCEVNMLDSGCIKDFIKRMLNTKREVKNLKEAKDCHIAGGAKKLTGIAPDLMEKINMIIKGDSKVKVLRIVKNGQVFYSAEYTRMVKRNAHVVLFACGKVGEIQYFVWDKLTGITLAVFREVQPDLEKPFFFDEAGHHTLRMKQERSELQVQRIEEIKEKVLFLEGNQDNLCLIRLPSVRGVCG